MAKLPDCNLDKSHSQLIYVAFEMVGPQDDYRAFSYISRIFESCGRHDRIQGRILGRYGGPRFRQEGIKVRPFLTRERAPHRKGLSSLVRTALTRLRSNAANYHWFSDLGPYQYEALHWMRNWSDPRAKAILFARDLNTGLQLVELIFLFAEVVPDGIVLVLLNDCDADPEKICQLSRWGVSIYADGSGYSVAGLHEDEQTPALDFNSKIEMPLQASKARSVDWPGLLAQSHLSTRAPEKVLFVRPDWMKCGSATTFSKLTKLFRERGAILVDVALQPYRERYTAPLIEDKLAAVRSDLNPAFHFNFRRSGLPVAAAKLLGGMLRHWPSTVASFMPLFYQQCSMPRKARNLLRSARFDYLYVNHYFTLPYARKLLSGRLVFLDTHDIQSLNYVSHDYHHSIKMLVAPFTACLRDELAVMDQADRVTLVSRDEIQLVSQYRPDSDLFYYIPIPKAQPEMASAEKQSGPAVSRASSPLRLLIVASRNPANERSLNWFLANVWPAFRSKKAAPSSKVELDIVGGISKSFKDKQFDGVNFLGIVEDLSHSYRQCDVILLPITNGGGIAIKTLEAIQYGKPIVATRHALRGLPETVSCLLEGCLSEGEFIEELSALVADPCARTQRAEVVRRIGLALRDCEFDQLMNAELDVMWARSRGWNGLLAATPQERQTAQGQLINSVIPGSEA